MVGDNVGNSGTDVVSDSGWRNCWRKRWGFSWFIRRGKGWGSSRRSGLSYSKEEHPTSDFSPPSSYIIDLAASID